MRRFFETLITDGSLARIFVAGLSFMLLGAHALPQALSGLFIRQQADNITLIAYKQAVEYAPYADRIILALARDYARGGETGGAIDLYRKVAARAPLPWEAWLQLGTLYASRGETDAAINAWENARQQVLKDSTVDPAIIFEPLTDAYIKQGDWSSVQSVLSTLNMYNPLHVDYRYELALVEVLNASPEAENTLAETVALDPSYARILSPIQAFVQQRDAYEPDIGYQQLGTLYLALNEPELARAAFNRAVLINPRYSQALAYRALTDFQLGNPDLAGVQQAVALSPDSPEVLVIAGLAWREMGEPLGARALFRQAYDLDPTNPAIVSEIATTYSAEGNFTVAEAWARESVRLAPEDPRFQILLAQFYLDENFQVATVGVPLARDLATTYPDNAEAQATLGQALFLVGDYPDAIEQLELAIMLDFRSLRAQFYLGQAHQAQGNIEEAARRYTNVIETAPGSGFAAAAERAIERLSDG